MQLIKRSLSVLRAVSEEPSGMTLQELSLALQIPAPTMHRLVGTLAAERFLIRSGTTKRYSIGPDAVRLATGIRPVAVVASDALAALSRDTGETSFLTELIGDRAVCVALFDSTRPLRLFVKIGQELPLHAAASSRSIIAFLDAERADELLRRVELVRFTAETPTSVGKTLEHLSLVRARGYDVCHEELDPNVCAVGAPVRNSEGAAIASVTVAGPVERLTVDQQLVDRVITASTTISEQLGFRSSVFQQRSTSGQ
jgi:DNA-binding IclR family transcriptional regulator